MSVWEFANPNNFMSWSKKLIPSFGFLAFFTIIIGFVWGLFFTPDDAVQGSAVKILFVHVPSAFLAINIYLMMFFASLIWLVRRHHVSVLAAKAAAPIGIVMTISAICTGALWGKPMWGTAWAWDPRLTSFALMLFAKVS